MKLFLSALILIVSTLPARAEGGAREAFAASYAAEAKKDINGAVLALRDVALRPGSEYLFNLRMGWLNYLSGKYNESAVYYRSAIKAAPKAVEPLQGLLLPLYAGGKYDEAAKANEDILALDANNYKALSGLALRAYALKDYMGAAKYYSRLVKLYPSDTEMLLGLGYSQKLGGFKEAAAKTFNEVLLISPTNPRALDGLK